LTNYLLKLATKGEKNYENKEIRLRIGYLAGIVGLIINITLAIIKLTIGLIISSIGVIADGFNNLSDSASSIIMLLGFKISNIPPDKEHPYGHARAEYIATLIIALMIIFVGFEFIKSSYERIVNPKAIKFDNISLIILSISILFKAWMSHFNRVLGDKINSSSIKATSIDSLGDVLTTTIVVLSLFVGRYTNLPIDGFVGLIIAVLIIYSGYTLVRETISALIGESPPEELTEAIYEDILSYDYITGAHDLVIHTYGVGKTMATIDVEFPSNIDVITIHNVIDRAERELGKKYNMTLVIHMDPLAPESKERYELRNKIKNIIMKNPKVRSMHDFVIFKRDNGDEIIEFHVVVDGNKILKQETKEFIKHEVKQMVESELTHVKCNIIVDIEY